MAERRPLSLTALQRICNQHRRGYASTQGLVRIAAGPAVAGYCYKIDVVSTVIEQGMQNALPFRLESSEMYTLEKQRYVWRATTASTVQN
jgi:hypothetical protein